MENLGQRIRMIRQGESRASFSSRLKISPASLQRYETGQRLPDKDFLERLVADKKICPKWLLTGDGPMYQGSDAQVVSAPKMTDMSVILEGDLPQHTDFISSEKSKMTDTSVILRLTEKCLQLSTENGDLRVEVERQRARIIELERQLVEALKAPQGRQNLLDTGRAAAG
ncbi:helix-turn-helix domain-containing protein [uncultured Desulfovibrio sp.]|uniref:helix-turn-helix domain-containing protein n=1 Tax=uncultured Desulfovibrio sp. TaxID=167968 RepID=UPI0034C5E652